MAKIKREVEMTLPELIEWGFKNNIKDRGFSCNQATYRPVVFDSIGWIDFIDDYCYPPGDTYTVEIEEEITEETSIYRLLELRNVLPIKEGDWENLNLLQSYMHGNMSISEVKKENSKYFYMLEDNGEMTLIWKDGELV